MTANTARFILSDTAYTDVSEGAESCTLLLTQSGRKDNTLRIITGTSLPDPGAPNYVRWKFPAEEDEMIRFTELAPAERIYVRLDRPPENLNEYPRLGVFRK